MPTIPGVGNEQDTVRMLLAQKQALITELKHYENNTKYNETAMSQTESFESHGVIPANTRLQIAINTNEGKKNVKPHVEIYVATNNTTIIRAIMIFAEGIFKGETHVVHPSTAQLKSELSVPLFLLKDTPVDIHIKVKRYLSCLLPLPVLFSGIGRLPKQHPIPRVRGNASAATLLHVLLTKAQFPNQAQGVRGI